MNLSKQDADLYYGLYWPLLFYVNQQKQIIPKLKAPTDFRNQLMKNVGEVENELFNNTSFIDTFVSENPFNFSEEKLEIIKKWKSFVKDDFVLIKHSEKSGAIFLQQGENPKAFGVSGLITDLEEIFPQTPVLIGMILLPFKGKIVYTGILHPYNITFGGGIRRDFNEDFQIAKSKQGIITSLEEPISELKQSDEEMLKFYSKSETNRLVYKQQISEIIKRDPKLVDVHFRESSKAYSRKIKRHLTKIGVKKGIWFAVLQGTIVASAATEQALAEQIKEIVPEEKFGWVYTFKHK